MCVQAACEVVAPACLKAPPPLRRDDPLPGCRQPPCPTWADRTVVMAAASQGILMALDRYCTARALYDDRWVGGAWGVPAPLRRCGLPPNEGVEGCLA